MAHLSARLLVFLAVLVSTVRAQDHHTFYDDAFRPVLLIADDSVDAFTWTTETAAFELDPSIDRTVDGPWTRLRLRSEASVEDIAAVHNGLVNMLIASDRDPALDIRMQPVDLFYDLLTRRHHFGATPSTRIVLRIPSTRSAHMDDLLAVLDTSYTDDQVTRRLHRTGRRARETMHLYRPADGSPDGTWLPGPVRDAAVRDWVILEMIEAAVAHGFIADVRVAWRPRGTLIFLPDVDVYRAGRALADVLTTHRDVLLDDVLATAPVVHHPDRFLVHGHHTWPDDVRETVTTDWIDAWMEESILVQRGMRVFHTTVDTPLLIARETIDDLAVGFDHNTWTLRDSTTVRHMGSYLLDAPRTDLRIIGESLPEEYHAVARTDWEAFCARHPALGSLIDDVDDRSLAALRAGQVAIVLLHMGVDPERIGLAAKENGHAMRARFHMP